MIFRQERLQDIRTEIEPLLPEHWEEVALDQDTIKLDPDWEQYKRLEDLGMLLCITAREDGRLVGYAIWMITKSLHYKGYVFADNDVFFLLKSHRKWMNGYRLLTESFKILKQHGAHKAFTDMKLHRSVSLVFHRLGCKPIELSWAKDLRD